MLPTKESMTRLAPPPPSSSERFFGKACVFTRTDRIENSAWSQSLGTQAPAFWKLAFLKAESSFIKWAAG